MYNRYIPQPDGSFRRNSMPETQEPSRRQHPPQQPHRQSSRNEAPARQEQPTPDVPQAEPSCRQKPSQPDSVTGFLRNLLPKDFDTGDLLIILLLLIMAGDGKEDHNTALLTLALYLFM